MQRRDLVRAAAAVPLAATLASCSEPTSRTPTSTGTAPERVRPATSELSYAVEDPGPMRGTLLTADVLITSQDTIPASLRDRVAAVKGVTSVLPIGLSNASVSGRTLTIASVDPATFRRFTPLSSARADDVWKRVARGEVAVDPSVGHRVEQPAGFLTLGQGSRAPSVHIGAYAPLITRIQAVVDHPRGQAMRIPDRNALLVSTGELTPSAISAEIKKVLSGRATFQILATEFDVDAQQTAVLSGGSVTSAVGTFDYTSHPDGTVTPDSTWVRRYIRVETMPIIGQVTGNKGMLPQLRSALDETVTLGLASKIHPSEYGGCYVPRYISHDPALGLSLHSWGIAVDLNVPENQRGTRGHMDPGVIAAFKKWGFDWGGDWHYTDPMHFEMSSVVRPG